MEKHMKECAKVFLRDQKKLFDEPVVYDLEEAEDFLEECFAQYCSNIKELRQIMDDEEWMYQNFLMQSLRNSLKCSSLIITADISS